MWQCVQVGQPKNLDLDYRIDKVKTNQFDLFADVQLVFKTAFIISLDVGLCISIVHSCFPRDPQIFLLPRGVVSGIGSNEFMVLVVNDLKRINFK